MLKRKLDETVAEGEGIDNASTSNGQLESDDSNCSAGSTDALAPEVASGPSPPKRMKKKVNFKGVTVYYFPRRQGFTCVPSEGGSTLGMTEKHTFTRDFSLSDYTKEQKRIHRAILAEQRRQGKMFPSPLLSNPLQTAENEEDVSSGSESDSEYDDYYFLQPLPIRQRRVMLRTSGVKKIDNEEKEECRDIRVSRNVCGCDCKVFCDPATCSCSIAGIQCQVDRLSFPCGCTKDGCGNPAGRIEFNPIRVRTHFIHTLMRLELEKKDPECLDGNPAAATMSSSFSPSSSTSGEIDVVGANGEEEQAITAETTDNSSNDSCSGASTDAGSGGKFVLKSRLKSKKTEAIDLNMFNSNEKGSCRDCQNTDMCNVMMHDVKFSMVSQQQRQQQQQQQRVITAALGPQPGYPGSPLPQQLQHHHHHLNLSPGISLLHPPPPPPPQQQSQQHMLLFNDGEEEVYHAENPSSMYFDNDDSSYSEMSDTSPEGLESRPFASLGQPNFSHKFHVTPSQMFSASVNNSNASPVDNRAPRMPNQTSLLNPSCIQSLQVNGRCGANPTTSCNSMGSDHQQSCGLLSQSHVLQTSTTAVTGQSLLRPPYMHISTSSPGSCVGSQSPISSSTGFAVPNSPLVRPQISTSEGLNMSESNMMLPGSVPGFHSKYPHSQVMDTPNHSQQSYKVVPPLLTPQTYVAGGSSIPNTDYLNQPRHISSFTPPTSSDYGISTTSCANSGSKSSFEPLQTPQLSSCWSTSLVSPTLRECFGLGPPSSTVPSSSATDLQTSAAGASCSSLSYQPETDHSAVTASQPASPNSSTTTYATMTTTTRDRLAAHCPGISSHMDSRQELSPTSSQKDSTSSFPDYCITSENSETTNLVGSSQSLLYNSPYQETNSRHSCVDTTTTSATELKLSDAKEGQGHTQEPSSSSKPISSSMSTSPFTSSSSDPSSTSPVYSDEITFLCLLSPSNSKSSLELLSSPIAIQSSSETNHCPQATTITKVPVPTQLAANNRVGQEECRDSLSKTMPSTTADDVKSREAVAKVTSESTSSSGEAEKLKNESSHKSLNGLTSQDISSNWNSSEEKVKDIQCEKLSSQMPVESYEHERNSESCVTDSETSAVQSATSSTASSSSSSPTTLEEEKEQTVNQNFGEIIKESIVEMVVV